ncbi:unannotated protein [freshwater metagenome]|uniref:Unannotated protein n=1 Tax=freshwater metagenome TaxID=449393 RepID=A0A6J7K894_9ZZZZ
MACHIVILTGAVTLSRAVVGQDALEPPPPPPLLDPPPQAARLMASTSPVASAIEVLNEYLFDE